MIVEAINDVLPHLGHPDIWPHCVKIMRSQLGQDLFALSETGIKKGGFFVEFGATNGEDLSNTHMLEKEFGWTGILAEPAKCFQAALRRNRSAKISTDCVWGQSDMTIPFFEASVPALSTTGANDMHTRKTVDSYSVKTISLHDLLDKFHAPREIDYLSVDTEGSEFEILNAFDFSKYAFRVITVEHNFTPSREKVYDLLTAHGYKRKLEKITRFDDWYTGN